MMVSKRRRLLDYLKKKERSEIPKADRKARSTQVR
ncbi:MAG: hypothetical protein CM1200mP4_4570 [Rhodospirillaceae bacterium]|nr:MAG: hypothetical protein CM1200mP4_4570 [Rhodospirillaceae bacterium]